ncbi:MAG: hypothetical protein WDO16_11575 [Bacteroidota bacterium]
MQIGLSASAEELEKLINGIKKILEHKTIESSTVAMSDIAVNAFLVNADYFTGRSHTANTWQ